MIQGLYAAASGMLAVEDRQATIANNIANAATVGFKRQSTVQEGFQEVYFNALRNPVWLNLERGPGGGVRTTETYTDYSNGSLVPSGNPLDLALIGPGFMSVSTSTGEAFTRNGHLALSDAGRLVTSDGYEILDVDGGPIDVGEGIISIDGTGRIMVNGVAAGQIGIVEFEDPHMLERLGFTLYRASEEALARSGPAQSTSVAGNTIETSNVKIPMEISDMMLALRAYSANQRVINAIDETVSRLIDSVGSPQ